MQTRTLALTRLLLLCGAIAGPFFERRESSGSFGNLSHPSAMIRLSQNNEGEETYG